MDTIGLLWNSSTIVKNSPRLRILIVDDEPLIRWSLANTLQDSGHEAVEAADGATAVRAVLDASSPFDVVLLDFRLPDSSDLGLLSRLRQLAPTTRAILMTAYGTPEVVQGALALGVCRVVGKPLDMGEVPTLVEQAHAIGR